MEAFNVLNLLDKMTTINIKNDNHNEYSKQNV